MLTKQRLMRMKQLGIEVPEDGRSAETKWNAKKPLGTTNHNNT